MTKDAHVTSIIEDRLDISYEAAEHYENCPEDDEEEQAVFLLTRCCKINHEHISIDKMQAVKLSNWLHRFITG